ncbi:MAG: hypothetical protein M3295_09450 [Chloroflexota bacterium]|nr:hypothetical protein [Chloroflexota bacterium]
MNRNTDEEKKPAGTASDQAPARDEDEADTEGHSFLPDMYANQQIARGRSSDIDRSVREAQRRKEIKPNRNQRG